MAVGVLCVAEKPSLAASIAKFLSHGSSVQRRSHQDVHEFSSTFLGQPANIKVTSVIGHVYNADFPDGPYQDWDTDPVLLFDAPTVRKEANPRARICQHLKDEARKCHYIVLWLDCDREGENICYEVLDNTERFLLPVRGQQVFRANFSAITAEAINKAFLPTSLGKPNPNEAAAVDARQELDLKVGVAFTRFQTRYFQGRYAKFNAKVVSYGPCQTPTLGFCVDRHLEILGFQAQDYWKLDATIRHRDSTPVSPVLLQLQWSRGRVFDRQTAEVLGEEVRGGKAFLRVERVSAKEERKVRPAGLNTVEMLKMASRGLGMGPKHAMDVAERLYTSGYISYPRTESTGYPPGSDLHSLLRAQAEHPHWGAYVQKLLAEGPNRPRNGVDAGDHPPITPMRAATEASVGGGDAWRLYNAIARNFIGSLSPDATFELTKLEFRSLLPSTGKEVLENDGYTGELFIVSGKRVLTAGFTEIMEHLAIAEEQLPEFVEGEEVALVRCDVVCGKTSAPGYLTEAELIGVMERSGIGTDASIATHIENICKRNYVEVGSGRTMVPTDLGVLLVQGYRAIDPDLVEPTVRSYVERQLDTIASGKQDLGTVVSHVLAQFMAKFKYFVTHIGEMEELFEASMGPPAAGPTERALVKCGKTGLYLQLQPNARPPRLYNRQTEEVYRLPLGGSLKAFNGKLCPLDGFELCLYSTGGRSYPLCPNCFNYPPASIGGVLGAPHAVNGEVATENGAGDLHKTAGFGNPNRMDDPELLHAGKEDMLAELQRAVDIEEPDFDAPTGGGGFSSATSLCLRCPMSELHPAIEPLVVCACPDTAETGGALMLDPTGGPQWKLVSTQCSLMIILPAGAHRVRVLPDADEATGQRYLEVVFNKNRSPLGPENPKYTGLLGEGLFDLEAGLLTQVYGKGGPRRNGGGAANSRGRGRGGGGNGRGTRRGGGRGR